MKACAACSNDLPKEKFSNKQWRLKQYQRRCKDCIAANREIRLSQPGNLGEHLKEEKLPLSVTNDEPHWTDEDLFKQPPPRDDCPVCYLPLLLDEYDICYYPCCGKNICVICADNIHTVYAHRYCIFCRTPFGSTDEEAVKMMQIRMKTGDANAIQQMGDFYNSGTGGLPRDPTKALQLWLIAGKLGIASSYGRIGNEYMIGEGVPRDMQKAKYYWELAAMGGDMNARHELGVFEKRRGNGERAVKHFSISAGAGDDGSMKLLGGKEAYEKVLRAFKETKDAD